MRTILVAVTAILMGLAVQSQALAVTDSTPTTQPCKACQKMHHRGHRGHPMMRVLRQLNLTQDQKTQVKAIMQQARKDAAAAPDMQAGKEIRKQAWQKVRTQVLTDAQRQQAQGNENELEG